MDSKGRCVLARHVHVKNETAFGKGVGVGKVRLEGGYTLECLWKRGCAIEGFCKRPDVCWRASVFDMQVMFTPWHTLNV